MLLGGLMYHMDPRGVILAANEQIRTPMAFFDTRNALLWMVLMRLANDECEISPEAICSRLASASIGATVERLCEIRDNVEKQYLDGLPKLFARKAVTKIDDIQKDHATSARLTDYVSVDYVRGLPQEPRDGDGVLYLATTVGEAFRRDLCAVIVRSAAQVIAEEEEDPSADMAITISDRIQAVQEGGKVSPTVEDVWATLSQRGPAVSVQHALWGVDVLDRRAPLRGSELITLAARPGCGKTSLSLQAAIATAEHYGPDSVLMFTLEMSAEHITSICMARACRGKIDAQHILDNRLTEDQRKCLAALPQIGKHMTIVGQWDRVTHTDIINRVMLHIRRHPGKLRLVVIDYLQIMDAPALADSEYEMLTKATRAFKRLAIGQGIPVLALSQFNRASRPTHDSNGEIKSIPEPVLHDLRASGSIEQDSDKVLFLHRGRPQAKRTMCIVAKSRLSDTFRLPLEFDGKQQLFTPVAERSNTLQEEGFE